MTKRRSGFGTGKKECSWRAAECWLEPTTPCQCRSHGLSLSKVSPAAAEAVRTFASIVGKGAGSAKAFGAFATFFKEGTEREGRIRRFRGRGVVALCRVVSAPGREAGAGRTARFGLRGRRRPTLSGLPDTQGIVLAGRQWAENPAAALMVLDHCASREAAKLFGEPGGMNPSSSCALVRQAVSGRKGSRRPWIREMETGEAVRLSLDGVRPDGDEEACRASCGTVSFRDAEGGKRSVSGRKPARRRRNSPIAHVRKVRPELVAVADAAPDNRTFLEKLRRTDGRLFSCTSRFPTVASNWKYRAVLRDDVDGKVALFPRQGDDGTGGS